jgi:phosphatidylglycerophosphatase A
MRNFIIKAVSTVFFVGYSPLIPGTVASFVSIFVVILFKNYPAAYMAATAIIIAVGFLVSGQAEKIFNKKDDRRIVIDELAGIMVSFLFLPGAKITVWPLFWGFMLFRAFDALKIYPANKLQDLSGGLGVMADDLMAGVYTNIILQVFFRLASLRIS